MLIEIKIRVTHGDDGPVSVINSDNINAIYYDARNGYTSIQMRGEKDRLHLDEDIDDFITRIGSVLGVTRVPQQIDDAKDNEDSQRRNQC